MELHSLVTTRQRLLFASILLSTLMLADAHAQYIPSAERGDPTRRMQSQIDTNSIRTSVFNFGYMGWTGPGRPTRFEWPKGTGQIYLVLVGMFVGGEVVESLGDTVHIVSVPAFRTNPLTGKDWNFNPVPGYQNPASLQIARSDDPASWPPLWPDKLHLDSAEAGWPGSWNGFFGKDSFINGTEMYTHFSDDTYDRYAYYPDSTDTTRRGLGIVVSQRTLEWNEPFLNDAIFTVSDIYNVGRSNIPNAAASIWIAPLIGGDGDGQDDRETYDTTESIVYFFDWDGHSTYPPFQNAHVGAAGLVFLQTPLGAGLSNIQRLAAGTINFNTTPDSWLWANLMLPGQFFDPRLDYIGQYDIFASCGLFPLPSRSSQRFTTAIVFGEDTADVHRKARYLKSFAHGGFRRSNLSLTILSPVPREIVGRTTTIGWNASDGDPKLRIDLLYSRDDGDHWKPVVVGTENDGSYDWNTDSVRDGVFYKLMLIAYDSTHVDYFVMNDVFTVNNPQSAPPEIRIDRSLVGKIFSRHAPLSWRGGDPDGDPVTIDVSYRIDGITDWIPVVTGRSNTGSFDFDVSDLPNSQKYWMRVTMRDFSDSSGVDSIGAFEIRNPRRSLDSSAVITSSTAGTGILEVHVIDSSRVTGHTYKVTFTGSEPVASGYSVSDEQTHNMVLSDVGIVNGITEGPSFDGLRLFIQGDSTRLDTLKSNWSRSGIFNYYFRIFKQHFTVGEPEPRDYEIFVDTVGIDTSVTFFASNRTWGSRPVNFRVLDRQTRQRVPFAFQEVDSSDGRFSASRGGLIDYSDLIILLKTVDVDSFYPTWRVSLNPQTPGGNPTVGDTLHLHLFKPFITGDTYEFQAVIPGVPAGVVDNQRPLHYFLGQNYPNPFNPATSITFTIPHKSHVTLQVFNTLGQRVETLLNGDRAPGTHTIRWDASGLPSGIYFYRFVTGDYAKVGKMVLTR